MAMNKVWGRIEERLERIEERLAELVAQNQAPRTPEKPAIAPDQLARMLDYDSYAVSEIEARVDSLTAEERAALVKYEKANKNRKTAIAALVNWNS